MRCAPIPGGGSAGLWKICVESAWSNSPQKRLDAIVEKPKPEDTPTTLVAVGNYVLTPRNSHHLETVKSDSRGALPVSSITAVVVAALKILAIVHGS